MKIMDLLESSLSRVWKHIKGDNSFAVISAFRGSNTQKENLQNHSELKKAVKSLGLGFIEQKSGYTYTNPDTGEEGLAEEMSLFIPNIELKQAIKLAQEFDQESIIYKDQNRFDLVNSSDSPGKVMMKFSKDNDNSTVTFDPETLKYAYSQLLKGTKSSKKAYAFKSLEEIKELLPPRRTESIMASKNKTLAKARWINIL